MAKLTTGIVRLSYANIAQPRKNDDGKAKYSSQIIIDKTDKKTIKAFERAIEELKADPKAVAKVEGKAAYLKLNLRDGLSYSLVTKSRWTNSTSKKKSTPGYMRR